MEQAVMSKPLNRKDLYDLVWNKPMSTIAKEYGLSDRGIAKLCERHSVPVPPRGYWAQKAAGQKISKPPLIVIDKKEPETALLLKAARANPISTLNTNPKTETSLPASVQEAIAHEALPEHIITVTFHTYALSHRHWKIMLSVLALGVFFQQ